MLDDLLSLEEKTKDTESLVRVDKKKLLQWRQQCPFMCLLCHWMCLFKIQTTLPVNFAHKLPLINY